MADEGGDEDIYPNGHYAEGKTKKVMRGAAWTYSNTAEDVGADRKSEQNA